MVKRNSNIELLRIVAMFCIVLSHFGNHGLSFIDGSFSYNYIYKSFVPFLGNFGVNLFVIISSYFMLDSDFNYKKLIKLIGQVLFYSISILLLFNFILTPINNIGIIDIIKSIFPVLFTQYWFITDYIILMLLTPFLNEFITKIGKNNYQKLFVTLITISVVINGLFHFFIEEINNGLIWFIILYLIIGYIKKYVILDNDYKRNLLYFFIIVFINLIIVVTITVIGHIFNIYGIIYRGEYFGLKNTLFTLLAAIELFIAVMKMKPRNNNFINIIASTTLGIYLIHDNSLMRLYLWKSIFNVQQYMFSSYLVIYSIIIVLIIFVICSIIDLIRQYTVEKVWLVIGNKIYNIIEYIFNKIYNFVIYVVKKIKLI